MNTLARAIGSSAVAALGIDRLLHRVLFSNQLTILTYHAVVRSPLKVSKGSFISEALFRRQVNYVKDNFQVIPLAKVPEHLKQGKINQPTAVITFDDGYQNNYDFAFPIIRAAGLPATIFLVSGLVNTDDTAWFCRLHHAVSETSKRSLTWGGSTYDLSGPPAKSKSAKAIRKRLKQLPQPGLLYEVRGLVTELGIDPDAPVETGSPFRMLSSDAIKDMAASGLVDFGAHTETHAILSRLRADTQRVEVENSIAAVRELTGFPCELFAYPNGGPHDYDTTTTKILKECGIRVAVTGISGPNHRTIPLLELRRYGVLAGDTMAHFRVMSHHFGAKVRRLAL